MSLDEFLEFSASIGDNNSSLNWVNDPLVDGDYHIETPAKISKFKEIDQIILRQYF